VDNAGRARGLLRVRPRLHLREMRPIHRREGSHGDAPADGRPQQERRADEMSASPNDDKDDAGAPGQLPVEKVRDLVDQIKGHEATKPHGEELEDHVTALEAELGKEEPHPPTLASLLDNLRKLSAEATEGLIHSGAMDLLNEILGTGVPPVRR
jgi:hypothetical protein